MTDSSVTKAQQDFIGSLKDKIKTTLGETVLDGEFSVLNHPSGFPYYDVLPPNNYYNENLLRTNGLMPAVMSNGIEGLTDARFSNLYQQVLQSAVYVISADDQKIIDAVSQKAAAQQSAMITAFESDFGTITTSAIQDAKVFPETKVGYIAYIVSEKFGGDPRNIPLQYANFRNAYQEYENVAQQLITISTRATSIRQMREAAITNTQKPSATNGGFEIGTNSFDVAYNGIPTANQMLAALTTDSNAVSVEISVNNFSSKESSLSIDGKVGFSIPIEDVVTIGFEGSAEYGVNKYASSATDMEMSITYPGLTSLMSTKPMELAPDNSKGWFSSLIIDEIATKTNDASVSGLKLQGTEFDVDKLFGEGKKFSRVKTWVLSQTPTIEFVFKGGEVENITKNFKENASVNVKLFGLFDLGSVSESYSVKSVDDKSVSGSVKVTMGPTNPAGTVPPDKETAYVVGGVIDYPSAN